MLTVSDTALKEFGIEDTPRPLGGAEQHTFKAGNVVLKHRGNDTEEFVIWNANLFNRISDNPHFRVPRPLRTKSGKYITSDGWYAWTLLEGKPDDGNSIPQTIAAINSFHESIAQEVTPEFIIKNESPYRRADRAAFGDPPDHVLPELREMIDAMYTLRLPDDRSANQLIHGDLNPENILLHPSLPPAILDLAPYVRPVSFAQAVYAYWIGPWMGKAERLDHFSQIDEFPQMLLRAAIRMLLIQSEFNQVTDLERYKIATDIVIRFVMRDDTRYE